MPYQWAAEDLTGRSNGALETVTSGKFTKLTGSTSSVQVTSEEFTGSSNEAGQMITSWLGSLTLQWCEMTYRSGLYGGPTIFASQPYTFYLAECVSGAATLFKVVGGVFTSLSSTVGFSANAVIRIYCAVAGTIKIAANGTDIITVSDSSITSGKPGLRNWSDVLDDWKAGDFSTGPAGKLFRPAEPLTGLGSGGSFFREPLAAPVPLARAA